MGSLRGCLKKLDKEKLMHDVLSGQIRVPLRAESREPVPA